MSAQQRNNQCTNSKPRNPACYTSTGGMFMCNPNTRKHSLVFFSSKRQKEHTLDGRGPSRIIPRGYHVQYNTVQTCPQCRSMAPPDGKVSQRGSRDDMTQLPMASNRQLKKPLLRRFGPVAIVQVDTSLVSPSHQPEQTARSPYHTS